jgi:hypothetical protein
MIHDLYADNYQQRRAGAFLRSEGRCENLVNGQRCPNRLGTFKISRAHNIYIEQLFLHHPNGDPENPDADVLAVCASCHMRLHRQPGPSDKPSPRKQGYRVVRLDVLLSRLQGIGFVVTPNDVGRVTWRIGSLSAEAADPLDALTMAMHWLCAEVTDLQAELARARRNLETVSGGTQEVTA